MQRPVTEGAGLPPEKERNVGSGHKTGMRARARNRGAGLPPEEERNVGSGYKTGRGKGARAAR